MLHESQQKPKPRRQHDTDKTREDGTNVRLENRKGRKKRKINKIKSKNTRKTTRKGNTHA